jgi:hypothetical protein
MPLTPDDLPPWLIARIFCLEQLAIGMIELYLSSPHTTPTEEEAMARLEAFGESILPSTAPFSEEIRREVKACLDDLTRRARRNIEVGRAAALDASASASASALPLPQ